jgi:hypothetical protein
MKENSGVARKNVYNGFNMPLINYLKNDHIRNCQTSFNAELNVVEIQGTAKAVEDWQQTLQKDIK